MKTQYHYLPENIFEGNIGHPITVNMIGAGGTGSQVLTCLGRINHSLVALGKPGLHVRTFDPDIISEANPGRQLFSPAEEGEYKSIVLTERINRFFGTSWDAIPEYYNEETHLNAFLTISCVDNVKSRRVVQTVLENETGRSESFTAPTYWMDFGNGKTFGQAVLGTIKDCYYSRVIDLDVDWIDLPHVFELFPDMEQAELEDDTPSCSLAEALEKQDLFINSILAQHGANILWKLFKDGAIDSHGVYVNLATGRTSPIPISIPDLAS